jgi:hypothetical protein
METESKGVDAFGNLFLRDVERSWNWPPGEEIFLSPG